MFALRVDMRKQEQEIGPALQLASVVIWVEKVQYEKCNRAINDDDDDGRCTTLHKIVNLCQPQRLVNLSLLGHQINTRFSEICKTIDNQLNAVA